MKTKQNRKLIREKMRRIHPETKMVVSCHRPKVMIAATSNITDRSVDSSNLTPKKISLKDGMKQSSVSSTTAPNQNMLVNTQE